MKTFTAFMVFTAVLALTYGNKEDEHEFEELRKVDAECGPIKVPAQLKPGEISCPHLCILKKLEIIKNAKVDVEKIIKFFNPESSKLKDIVKCVDEVSSYKTDCEVEHHLYKCIQKLTSQSKLFVV